MMRKLITTALIATGMLGLSACSGGENAAVANGAGAGNTTVADDGLSNDVTAVDGDATIGNGGGGLDATANGADAAALPADTGVANVTDNAAAPSGNSF